MTYASARGETPEAMADALRYRLRGPGLHGAFAAHDAEALPLKFNQYFINKWTYWRTNGYL